MLFNSHAFIFLFLPVAFALAWVLAQGGDVVPIPGTKRRPYLDENAAAVEVHLTPAQVSAKAAAIDETTAKHTDGLNGARKARKAPLAARLEQILTDQGFVTLSRPHNGKLRAPNHDLRNQRT